ncbi:MAG: OmpA family protein [Myxococcales bacterium]|nr:OmpA family protein [Myxococcales bacterium]
MKPSGTRSLRRPEGRILALALLLAAAAGCVTRGTHQEVVDERERLRQEKAELQQQVKRLSASNESLGSERVRLIEEMEDLHQARATLETDVRKLARTEAILSEALREREAQLASNSQELRDLRGTYHGLVNDLQEEVASGQIEIEQLREGLRLNLTQDVLFASGSVELNAAGVAVVKKVAARLKSVPNGVEVQGHTDSVPIRAQASARFPTNWELAASRASQVVRLLQQEGVEPGRLSAVSFGPYRPVASNDTREGRGKNRRIEIRLQPLPRVRSAGSGPASVAAEAPKAPADAAPAP